MNPTDPLMVPQDAPGSPDVAGVPVRYRTAPLLALVVLALFPLAALTGLLAWSDAQADEYESSATDPPETVEAPSEPGPALPTTMIDYRRAPGALAQLGADNELSAAMEQLAAFNRVSPCRSTAETWARGMAASQ